MSVQTEYDKGVAELLEADQSIYQADSTNHATLACAHFLRTLVEFYCAKPEAKPTGEGASK